eukprot:scaffold12339_cov53-Phaeocystis_antarctica.AAC.1
MLIGGATERDTKERRHFSAFVNSKDFVMVAYGAPWCPWSRRMEPVWKALHMTVLTSPLHDTVALGRVDCTVEKQLCASQQVSAFPTLRIYRAHDTHSHENYHGDRTVEALHDFLQESVEGMEEAAGFHPLTHLSHRAGEGCQVSGGVLISRVPGSLRFSAQSPQAALELSPHAACTAVARRLLPPGPHLAPHRKPSFRLGPAPRPASHALLSTSAGGALLRPADDERVAPRVGAALRASAVRPRLAHRVELAADDALARRHHRPRGGGAAAGDLCDARAGDDPQALPEGRSAAEGGHRWPRE